MGKLGSDIAAGLLAALIVAGSAAAGINAALGAHPWWALKTGLVGAVIGMALFAVALWLGLSRGRTILVGMAVVLVAGGAAHFGKVGFVASFGDNALAGTVWFLGWFLGWFGVSAGVALTLGAALASRGPHALR